LTERLAHTARWFVSSVNENIIENDIQETKGRYVCFVLVRYPHDKIDKLRKLTIGAKAGARIVSMENGQGNVEVRENNEVEILLTECEVKLATMNRHADIITMFFMKVPRTAAHTAQGVFEKKVSVRFSSGKSTLTKALTNLQQAITPCPDKGKNSENLTLKAILDAKSRCQES